MWEIFGLKDKIKENLQESLFDKDLTIKKTVPEKLTYVLKKFFGNNIGLCQDHQGKTVWYEINPLTMEKGLDRQSLIRIIKYCEKIDELEIINTGSKITIGVGDYWIYLQLHTTIRVSKEFYECGALPINNEGVSQRGWSEWQRQRL